MEELLENKLGLKVLTDTGWNDFGGLLRKGTKLTVEVKTQNQKILCTLDHDFFLKNKQKISAKSLKPRDEIMSNIGFEKVVSVTLAKDKPVYDLLNVGANKRFYANNLLVSNCEFIIHEETLISPVKLIDLSSKDPIFKTGQVRWFQKPKKDCTYVVALDPSLGTGSDPAAIQVFEANSTRQIAEWRHNKTDIPGQVKLLVDICAHIYEEIGDATNIYYSIENNTLGEAALISIQEYGEHNIRGYFLSDIASNSMRRFRKGFNTTPKSKITACAKLKNLIESGRMSISSAPLISELKTFVSYGTSYAAKPGETDDLVMALILAIRMMQVLQTFNPELDRQMRDHGDQLIEPMPFISVSRL